MDDEREASRLAKKVNPTEWITTHFSSYLGRGMSVLDIGCGPGVIAGAIGSHFSKVKVTGVDISKSRLIQARKNCKGIHGVHFTYGNAFSLPFITNRFDFVYSRLLMEYLPNPIDAVGEMARVCRPGGRVLIQDLDGQLLWHYPLQGDLEDRIHKILKYLQKTGFDPFAGRKLFYLLKRNGLQNIDVKIAPYHLYVGRIGEDDFKLWKLKLEVAKPQIVLALGSEEEGTRLIWDFLKYLQGEDTLTYSTLFTVSGVVREN